MSIYDNMESYLHSLRANILLTEGLEKGVDKDNVFHMPEALVNYLNTRRNVLSDAHCRAQDTIQQHLSWHVYLTGLVNDTPVVDGVAWEILYNYLNTTLSAPYEAIHCLEMRMSSDPAHPHIQILGFKEAQVITGDGTFTTPEYVALGHIVAEHMDGDITELHPSIISITSDDMQMLSNEMKKLFGDGAPDAFEMITSIPSGQDVFLA